MGLLDRIKALGASAKAAKTGHGLERKYTLFQQQAVQFLRECRVQLVKKDKNGVQVWAEKFYRNFHDFTKLQDQYKAQGRETYKVYTDMVNALGPIYEDVNLFVTGQKVDVENTIRLIDNNSRFIGALKIEKREAA